MSHHRAIPRSVSGGPSQQFTSTIGPSHPNSSDPLVRPTRALEQLRFTEYEAGSVNGIREETLLAAISCEQTPDTENAKGVILFKGYIVPGNKFKNKDEEESTAEEKTKAEEKAKADADVLRSYIDGVNTAASCVTFYNSMIDEAVNLEQTKFDPNSNKNPPTIRAATGAVSNLRIIHKNLSGISRPKRALQFNAVHDGWKQRCDQGVTDPSQHPGSRSTKNPELHRLSQDSNIEQTVQILSHPSFKPPPTRHDVAFLNCDGTQITIQKGTKVDSLKSDQSTADKTSAGKRTVNEETPPPPRQGKRRQRSEGIPPDSQTWQAPTVPRQQASHTPSYQASLGAQYQQLQSASPYDSFNTSGIHPQLFQSQSQGDTPGYLPTGPPSFDQAAAMDPYPQWYGGSPVWPSYPGDQVPPVYGNDYFAEPDPIIPQLSQNNATFVPQPAYRVGSVLSQPWQAPASNYDDRGFDAASVSAYTQSQLPSGHSLEQDQVVVPTYASAVYPSSQNSEDAIRPSSYQHPPSILQPTTGAPGPLEALRPYLLYPPGSKPANIPRPGQTPKQQRGPRGGGGRP
jgi:hypothetical protein